MTPYLDGVETDELVCASVNVRPSRAILSSVGVLNFDSGLRQLTSPEPMSSAYINMMLGLAAEATPVTESSDSMAGKHLLFMVYSFGYDFLQSYKKREGRNTKKT